MRPLRATLAAILAPLALAACDARPAAPASPAPAETRFSVAAGGRPFRMRLALTELELARGLMRTASLPDDEAMIFLYRDNARRAFWMKNVPYDLDLAFFTEDGALDEIVRLRADDETPVPSASERIRFALEAPAGKLAALGLKRGAQLDLAALAAAVRARGFRAEDFIPSARADSR